MMVKDANNNELKDGDTVKLIKDLKLKGTSTTLKRGTTVKNIRLTDNENEIDCRVNKMSIVLKTEFVKNNTN
jgi:protein PhnA|tara:strand:- start:2244 stop:2459 length:216 start_codon:yes stop_codon:yes gene_type:complete